MCFSHDNGSQLMLTVVLVVFFCIELIVIASRFVPEMAFVRERDNEGNKKLEASNRKNMAFTRESD